MSTVPGNHDPIAPYIRPKPVSLCQLDRKSSFTLIGSFSHLLDPLFDNEFISARTLHQKADKHQYSHPAKYILMKKRDLYTVINFICEPVFPLLIFP